MLIKICGLRLVKDAVFAAERGADLLGIVVSASSKRRASRSEARAVLALDIQQPKYLVFGYDDVDFIRETFTALAKNGTRLQIMADHPQIDMLLKLAPTDIIMPSISASHPVSAASITRWEKHPLVLFDSHRASPPHPPAPSPVGRGGVSFSPLLTGEGSGVRAAGGTGKTFNPAHIAGVTRPYLYAGGLTPDNVAEIVTAVNPTGVDVASGTESSPGVKDHEKIYRFILNAREAKSKRE